MKFGAAEQQIARTALVKPLAVTLPLESGRAAGEAAAHIHNAFTRGGRAAGGIGGSNTRFR